MSRGGYAMNEMLLELGQNAKEAENMLRTITTNKKNQVLAAVAEHLVECTDELIKPMLLMWRMEKRTICRKDW